MASDESGTRRLLAPLFTTRAMRSVFDDRSRLQAMLDFEAGLARALARTGTISRAASEVIAAECRAELYDIDEIAAATAAAGNPAIPLVRRLTNRVAERDEAAAGHVHLGATSQDVVDTGLVLQSRKALDQVEAGLASLSQGLADLATGHRDQVLAGRTWLQQGPPVTLGLKAAGWLSAVERHRDRLSAVRPTVLVLQFGGAVGTLASLRGAGLEIAAALADELDLALPDVPWHTQRDRFAEVGATLGLVTGTLGKLARDLSLLMQTEVGEALEPAAPGRGGSSTMPHKRNPVSCAVALSAATRVPGLVSTMLAAMVQEHERGLGTWQAEWEALPEIFECTAGAIREMDTAVRGLETRADRMRANLEVTGGQLMAEAVSSALAGHLGRAEAHRLVAKLCQRASQQGRTLHEILAEDRTIASIYSAAELDHLLDPASYLGLAGSFVDRVLARRDAPDD
ncbi:MAG TPA: 3-carboxy-cis,cis-muconate cycloisomerase [Gammaproteobacteria bacterium]|nr:3-carboxy-cis,cis-muconate cycloisomerase [Gammaproteobacteria bacterium]